MVYTQNSRDLFTPETLKFKELPKLEGLWQSFSQKKVHYPTMQWWTTAWSSSFSPRFTGLPARGVQIGNKIFGIYFRDWNRKHKCVSWLQKCVNCARGSPKCIVTWNIQRHTLWSTWRFRNYRKVLTGMPHTSSQEQECWDNTENYEIPPMFYWLF